MTNNTDKIYQLALPELKRNITIREDQDHEWSTAAGTSIGFGEWMMVKINADQYKSLVENETFFGMIGQGFETKIHKQNAVFIELQNGYEHKPMSPTILYLYDDKETYWFVDGVHRNLAYRDHGAKEVLIQIPKTQFEHFKAKFKVQPA